MTGRADAQTTFELIAEYTNDVVVRVGLDGQLTYISPAIRKYGYEPEAVLAARGLELFHPDDRQSVADNTAALVRGELDPGANRQHRFRKADGTWAMVEGNPRIVFDSEGRPVEFLNIFRDITARWEAEEARQEQSQLLEAAFTHTAVGKALARLDGTFFRINEAFCRITGYSQAEMLKLDFQTITHPDDLAEDLRRLDQLTRGQIDSYAMDKRYVRHDGSVIWVHLTVSMIWSPDGTPKYYVAEVQDLTARMAAEAAVENKQALYRLIADNMTDIIVLCDLDGIVTYVSPSVANSGWVQEALLGRSFVDYCHPDDAPAVEAAFSYLARTGADTHVRWRGRHGVSGDWVWMESRPTLLRDPATHRPTGFIDVVRDVSQAIQQEAALALAKQEAEAASAVKSQFLANMSHEIRTPLTAILGFTQLLRKDSSVTDQAAIHVKRVAAAGKGLLAIVNDVLDFSKLEAGKIEVRTQPTKLAELCEEVLMIFSGLAEAKGLALQFSPAGDLPDLMMIDGDHLRQVLINLVGNAVKFTDHGGVDLRLCSDQAAGQLVIEVADTGPGLDVEAQARLFQRFTQIDGSATRKHGGTGLGLAISRGLVEAMGGSICVASRAGEGACFAIMLPMTPAERSPGATDGAAADLVDAMRVLVVDDNPANRDVVRYILEAGGADVFDAGSGLEALDLLALQPVDLVLLDLRMPGLSGRQTLERLRGVKGPNSAIPVLAFTADAEAVARGDLESFDGMVRKPIDPTEMLRAIAVAVAGDGASLAARAMSVS